MNVLTKSPLASDVEALDETVSAIFLSEELTDRNEGASFLDTLSPSSLQKIRQSSNRKRLKKGSGVFFQGDQHNGIWLIESGSVRTFYAGPSGREITLAFWTPGHFIGGPEIFGGSAHIWSADIHEDAELLFLPGGQIKQFIETIPGFALCLIEGLVAKGKCYSALVQMFGTRSVIERLAHLLIIFADTHGRRDGDRLHIEKRITHDQLAHVVGATRQWVTMSLDKFQKKGLISVRRQSIVIEQYDMLKNMTD